MSDPIDPRVGPDDDMILDPADTPDARYIAQLAEAADLPPGPDRDAALDALHESYGALQRGAATKAGLPYPSPTDPIAEGADAIRALAEALEPRYGFAFREASQGIKNNTDTNLLWPNDSSTFYVLRGGMQRTAHEYIVPTDGIYEVRAAVAYRGDVTSNVGDRTLQLRVNGAIRQYAITRIDNPHQTSQPLQLTYDLRLDAGEKVTALTTQTSGKTLTVAQRTFSIRRIIPL